MRWARPNVDPVLALRTVAANDRWEEAWPQVRAHTRTLSAARRQQRRQTRRASAVPPPATPTLPRAPRRTGSIPALPPERVRRPHP